MLRLSKTLLSASVCLFLLAPSAFADEPAVNPDQQRFTEIYNLIQQYHVTSPSDKTLVDGAVKGMIDALHDPYTQYFTDDEFNGFMDDLEGKYEGIGIVIADDKAGLFVQQVFEGSPAEKAGMKAGDKITAVNGKAVSGRQIDDVLNQLKGEDGSQVTLTLERNKKKMDVKVTRGEISMPMVQSKTINGYGYIALAGFSDEAAADFTSQLKKLQSKNIKGLIVDLRDNPGGILQDAVQLGSLFVKSGPFVYMKDNGGQEQSFDVQNGSDWKLPLAVLVNENTASAAEATAAGLSDYGKAVVIGTHTYGKGVVQELIPLDAGGVLKLTTQEYFSPKHHVINHIGVIPDILVGDPDEQLQAALYVLNKSNTLTLGGSGQVLVNGEKEKAGAPAAIRQNGRWMLSLRQLAYLFHGKIGYDPVKKEATLAIGGKQQIYKVGSTPDLNLVKGTLYLPLDAILKDYTQLQTTTQNGSLILTLKK